MHGKDIREFITLHRDPFDFMLRAKVPRNSTLIMQWKEWGAEQQLQHITRYFIARSGGTLLKRSPPTGEPGTWKRKNGVSDEVFHAVMREIVGVITSYSIHYTKLYDLNIFHIYFPFHLDGVVSVA